MTIVIKFFMFILFLSIIGCKKERKYVYPLEDRFEIQRVCSFVKSRNTNRFMVLLGKIYPLNNDGVTVALENISTRLEDAGYFCGNYRLKNFNCLTNEKEYFYKKDCLISG